MNDSVQLSDLPKRSRFKPYPDYKDSGVEWLGNIPAHWNAERLRFACSVNPSKAELSDLPASTEVSFMPMEAISEDGEINLEQTRRLEQVRQGYTNFRDGDVVVAKITPCFENGKGALCANLLGGVGFGTTELQVLRPSEKVVSPFIFYLTKSHPFRNLGIASMQGSAGQQRVTDEFIKDFRLSLPPLPEQHAIAAFLDRETAKIDALVAKKERLIDLLQEKRAALITHAVTKGLDPIVPMKDSGVEWLGQIPAHWTLSTVRRFLGSVEQGWSPVAEDRIAMDEEWAVLKLSAVAKGKFRQDEHKALPESVPPEIRYQVHPGDFLLTRANTPDLVGDVCVVEVTRPRLMLSDLVYRIRFDLKQVNLSFLCYWFLSGPGRYQIARDARGSSQSMVKVSGQHIRSWFTLLPPLQEQRAITLFLDRETAKLDALIAKVREGIEKLKEYRTALVSAAVTGKIDVREAMPTTPANG